MTTTEPHARFADLVAAEWIKLWSLRSTAGSLLIAALAVLGLNVGTAYDQNHYWAERTLADQAEFIREGLSLMTAFTSNGAMVLMLALGAFGAMAVTGEYGTGLIRATFAAVPARSSVLAAKVVVVGLVSTVFGAVLAAASFVLTQAVFAEHGAGVSFDRPGALRLVAASALLAPLSALTGMAVGALVRHGAGAVVGSTVLLLLVPIFLSTDRYWTAVAAHAMPYRAWTRLVDVVGTPAPSPYPGTVGGAWTVYPIWVLLAAGVTVAAVRRRDQ
ncbi:MULTISPECIES: ABC transporter permease [unclassified Kitasatospora]|uniref:ABC transporter permease n=1 Tax=unclassified Kitasatospora TaxID=2633591 RepID=UPI0007096A2F|nr:MULTISPECIES: ABC transporter permease [unclassified Kitasatospora]KQV21306.1 ABC transporter permease [Kitasatospora sp. Root107]KRB69493.1 ABC transporter permease [Kitasatospora sp. Root187]